MAYKTPKITQFSIKYVYTQSIYVVSATYLPIPPVLQNRHVYSPIFTNKWIQPSHTMDVINKNKGKKDRIREIKQKNTFLSKQNLFPPYIIEFCPDFQQAVRDFTNS